MTTIAWDGLSLAADRRTSCGNNVWRTASKIREIKGGHIACAGQLSQGARLCDWISGGMEGDPPQLDDCEAIMVKGGTVTWWDGSTPVEIDPAERISVGSGWQFAIAAMDHGKSAKDAVIYAATRDNGTGDGVDVIRPKRGRA